MQRDTVAAQQAAIQEVRARYERGELSYEDFRRALDAVVLARDEEECRAVLDALPVSQAGALAAFDPVRPQPPAPANPPALPASGVSPKWLVAFMASTKKTRRRWRLEPHTNALAVMGEVKVDLGVAELPPQATLDVTAIMGEVTIYVPRSVRVSVRSVVVMGEVNALGESTGGMFAGGREVHAPDNAAPAADLEIRANVLMGEVKIVLTDGPVVSVSEVVREALRQVAGGIARGYVAGASNQGVKQIEPG